jgi:hypothetical protein
MTRTNTGILHCVQDDDEEQTTATADPYGMTTKEKQTTATTNVGESSLR